LSHFGDFYLKSIIEDHNWFSRFTNNARNN